MKRKELIKMFENQNENERERLEETLENKLENIMMETEASIKDFKKKRNTNLVRDLRSRVEEVENTIAQLEKLDAKEEGIKLMKWAVEEGE